MSIAIQNSITRLGKSLDAYKKDAILTIIAVGDLVPYANQARETFPDEPLLEMAETMKTVGVLYPPLVRPLGNGKYEILDGERRCRAALIALLASMPCLVKDVDDAMADKIHMLANIQRENLTTAELTQRVQKDIAAAKGSLSAVAQKYGKSKSWVSKLASIASGGEIMGQLVEEGVTADRAVLATVASMERKAPSRPRLLSSSSRPRRHPPTSATLPRSSQSRPRPRPHRRRAKEAKVTLTTNPHGAVGAVSAATWPMRFWWWKFLLYPTSPKSSNYWPTSMAIRDWPTRRGTLTPVMRLWNLVIRV